MMASRTEEEISLRVTDLARVIAFMPTNFVQVTMLLSDDLTITCLRLTGCQNVFKLSLTSPQSTSKIYSFMSQMNPHFFSLIWKMLYQG